MGYLVRRTFRSFTAALEERLNEHDVSISMWFFLRLLWEGDGRNQKELGEELGLSPPATVAAMDNLERRGLIRRQRSEEDRRRVNIYLTRAGRSLKTKLVHYAAEVNEIALKDLSPGEAAQLRQLLLKVNGTLTSARKG